MFKADLEEQNCAYKASEDVGVAEVQCIAVEEQLFNEWLFLGHNQGGETRALGHVGIQRCSCWRGKYTPALETKENVPRSTSRRRGRSWTFRHSMM